jgi:cyclopropane-fatty-acyl-phospholipid synthase
MQPLLELAERGVLPDPLIRLGIRVLNRARLRAEARPCVEAELAAKQDFLARMRRSPVALVPELPNRQHYELPPPFFQRVLGRNLKYSCCWWPTGVDDLDTAEEAMLELTVRRAELVDGMRILELGCGWGALTLWIASRFPRSRVTAVSNSSLQGRFVRDIAAARGLDNVSVVTADMNAFTTEHRFDRVVSVEMFEHLRNWPRMLARIDGWLEAGGTLFLHVFTHRRLAYAFESEGADNWMGRTFFSGGMMPSDDLLLYCQEHLAVERHWRVDGRHYQKTAEAWLANMERHRQHLLAVLEGVTGAGDAARWYRRWRMFFMACAELWGFRQGQEWLVSHYRLRRR